MIWMKTFNKDFHPRHGSVISLTREEMVEQIAGQMQQMLQFMTPAEPAAPAAAPAQEDNN